MGDDKIIDIEVMQDVDKRDLPAVLQKNVEPNEIIEQNIAKVRKLYDSISNKDTTISDKINELLKIKTAMLSPLLEMIGNPENADADMGFYITNVTRLINDIEVSLYKKADFEIAQEVDFHHPKIQLAFKFLYEVVKENLSDFLTPDEMDIFSQQFSIALTGFEDELNTRLKGLSSSVLSTIPNPILKKNKAN